CLVAAPMRAGERSHGVVAAYGSRRFEEDDATFLAQAAALLGGAVEQHRRQARVQRSEARLRELLAEAPDALVTIDAAARVISFNSAAEALTGRTSDEVVDRALEEVIPELARLLDDTWPDELAEVAITG